LFNAQPQAPATRDVVSRLVAGACGWALNDGQHRSRTPDGARL